MITHRNLLFTAFTLILLILFREPLRGLILFSTAHSIYSYIIFIPFVSMYFLYLRKEKIFSRISYSIAPGSLTILTGLAMYFLGKEWGNLFTLNDYFSVMTISALVTWIGGFIFFYGIQTLHNGFFPLCFLFFMVPIPNLLLEQVIVILQRSSAETTDWIFKIIGIPVQRDGYMFRLSQIGIEVAKQCSGIRSGLILFMTSLVFGQLFLSTPAKRVLLTLSVFPITIFKNALRIVILSVLGNYVSIDILSSTLHRRGGIPFFIFAVVLLALVVRWLQSGKKHLLTQGNFK